MLSQREGHTRLAQQKDKRRQREVTHEIWLNRRTSGGRESVTHEIGSTEGQEEAERGTHEIWLNSPSSWGRESVPRDLPQLLSKCWANLVWHTSLYLNSPSRGGRESDTRDLAQLVLVLSQSRVSLSLPPLGRVEPISCVTLSASSCPSGAILVCQPPLGQEEAERVWPSRDLAHCQKDCWAILECPSLCLLLSFCWANLVWERDTRDWLNRRTRGGRESPSHEIWLSHSRVSKSLLLSFCWAILVCPSLYLLLSFCWANLGERGTHENGSTEGQEEAERGTHENGSTEGQEEAERVPHEIGSTLGQEEAERGTHEIWLNRRTRGGRESVTHENGSTEGQVEAERVWHTRLAQHLDKRRQREGHTRSGSTEGQVEAERVTHSLPPLVLVLSQSRVSQPPLGQEEAERVWHTLCLLLSLCWANLVCPTLCLLRTRGGRERDTRDLAQQSFKRRQREWHTRLAQQKDKRR